MVVVDFTFESRRPEGELAQFVNSIWYARGQITYRRERIAPTGSTVGGIVLGAPIRQTPNDGKGEAFEATLGFLIGPHDRPIVNEPIGVTHCVGIVTAPAGCRAVFGLDPAPIRGRIVDLLAVWSPGVSLRRQLLSLGEAGSDPAKMLDLVEAVVGAGLDTAVRGQRRCAIAAASLEADPTCSIAALARTLGLSHGHLDREFTRIVGLSPRAFSRTVRVSALLERLDVHGQIDWTAHAAALGWFDQAHLIRDFKQHTGVTPTQYQAAQRRLYEPGEEAPGFVPDITM